MTAAFEMLSGIIGINWHGGEEAGGLSYRWTGPGAVSRLAFSRRLHDGEVITLELPPFCVAMARHGVRFLVDYVEVGSAVDEQNTVLRFRLRVPPGRSLEHGPSHLHIYVGEMTQQADGRMVGIALCRVLLGDGEDTPAMIADRIMPGRPSIDFFLSAHVRGLCRSLQGRTLQQGLQISGDANQCAAIGSFEVPMLDGQAQLVEVTSTLFSTSGRLLISLRLQGIRRRTGTDAPQDACIDCAFHRGVLRLTADDRLLQTTSVTDLLGYMHLHIACMEAALQSTDGTTEPARLWPLFTACLSQLGQAVATGRFAIRLRSSGTMLAGGERPDHLPAGVGEYALLGASAQNDVASDYRHVDIRYRFNGHPLSVLVQMHRGSLSIEIRNHDLREIDFDEPGAEKPSQTGVYRARPVEEQLEAWRAVPRDIRALLLFGVSDHHYLIYDRLRQSTSLREARQWLDSLRDCGQWLEELEDGGATAPAGADIYDTTAAPAADGSSAPGLHVLEHS